MPGGNGESGNVTPMVGGVFGVQQAGPGDLVRAAEAPGQMGGASAVPWGGQYPAPAQAAPTANQSPIGFSITLSREQVEQAIKARALKFAAAKGVTVPADETDFQFRAKVHWTQDGGAAVTLEV